jgi:hypothetical protein
MTRQKSIQGTITLVILAILAILYLLVGRNDSNDPVDRRKKEFRHNQIRYTGHAVCRMKCRSIDETEVENILRKGEINYQKSDLKDKPCPVYALEGLSDDGQHIRVITGNCHKEAVIITVIDLDNDHPCDCE